MHLCEYTSDQLEWHLDTEHQIDAALQVGVDYVILDGRGGGTGTAQFFESSVDLMKVLARSCGHTHLNQFNIDDLTTFKRDMAYLTGIAYGGVTPLTPTAR